MKSFEWKDCSPVRKLTLLFAGGLGLGLSPVAPGTTGSLLGVLIVAGLSLEALIPQICLAVLCVILAVPLCGIAEKHFGNKDDSRIVADEYLAFPICVLGLPWQNAPWLLALAFVTHRLLDIIKPFPAGRLQKLEGGKGIVIDDVISSFYALALNHTIFRIAMML